MHLPVRLAAALTAALSAVAALVVAALIVMASPAGAANCTVISFEFDASSGGVILNPAKVTVGDGACVRLHNNTITSADFTVGSHYKATAPAFSDATPNYVAGPAGSTQPVTASGAAGTAKGSIVVKPAPAQPTPSPTRSTTSPPPSPSHQSSSPTPTATRPSPLTHTPTASPPPVQPLVSPPAGTSPFLAGRPTPAPSPSRSATTVVSGPLQPPTDRGTGLPAALAALAVVGTAGALLRVLLAEPLDSGPLDSGPLRSGHLGPVDSGHFVGPAL